MRFDLPRGLTGNPSLPKTQTGFLNCFNNAEDPPVVLQRPGIQLLNTTSGVARGHFNWLDRNFVVKGETLFRVDETTGNLTSIGTVAGNEPIATSIGFNFAVIVVKGATGKGFTLSVTDTLTEITDAQFKSSVSVANINGITVYIPFDGSPAFFGDPGAPGTIQVTSFFDAEQLPDRNNAVFNLSNTLYIMGTDSIEPFRVVTSPTLPFRSVTGGRINNGFIGGLVEYGETFLFIGKEKDQGFGIYAIGQGRAPKISNERIDKILSEHTQAELAEAIPGTIKVQGHFIATFQLRRSSFGFYKGEWFELETVFEGESRPWGGGFIAQLNGKYFTAFEDKLGVFDENLNTDYGERVTRSIKMIFIQEDGNWFGCSRIELGISQGFTPDKTVESAAFADANINSVTTASMGGSFSGNDFSVSTQGDKPEEIVFNNDGTKFFTIDEANKKIFEYTVSVPFDLSSTVAFSGNSFDVDPETARPSSVDFNNNGSKLFVVDNDNSDPRIYEYSMSAAFDITTASFTGNSFSFVGQDPAPEAATFNNDGTKMFMVGTENCAVFEYALSTAFDITTVSFTGNSFSVITEDVSPEDINFNNSGTLFYILGDQNNTIFEYSMSVAFDLGSNVAFTGNSFSVGSQETEPRGFAFNNDQTKIFLVGTIEDKVFEYNISWGVAQFNFTPVPTVPLSIGQSVTISGYVLNPLYNATGNISATNGTSNFSILAIKFNTNEPNVGSVRISTGTKTEIKPRSVALLTSRDGVLFGPEVYRELGLLGDYQSRLIWRRIGRFQSFMAVEFRTTQDVNFSVAYVEAAIA